MRGGRGFTLIELMIVIAIIAIIAAVALPSLLRSKISANEASAISTLRALLSSQEQFRSANDRYATLEELVADYVPLHYEFDDIEGMDMWTKSGYELILNPLPYPGETATQAEIEAALALGYCLFAEPLEWNVTGTRTFFADQSGVIRHGIDPLNDPNIPDIPEDEQTWIDYARAWPPIDG